MKNWFEGTLTRRLLSLALSMAMVLSVLPAGALAEEVESTPPTCTCEVLCAETVNESCPVCGTEGGQCAAVQQQKPEQQESEQKQEPVQEPKTETCTHGNDPEACEACASAKKVAQVQALIDALPEEVTAENKEAAQSALSAVDEAKSALTESEQTKLDMTRYTALTQKLAALEAQVNNCAHGNAPETCEACASEARVASVQKLIDELPDADSITADNAEEVIEQMGQIDAAAMLLSEAELAKLDFTKFEAAEARLTELSEQTATDQPVAYADNISYLDSDGNTQTCTTATVVTGSDTAWGTADTDTWYVVQDTVDIGTADAKQRVTVNGDVHLILADGCNFTVSGGISVNAGNSLTIYAQSGGENMGSLTAQNVAYNNAGIGGGLNTSGGNITINGGTVTATGGSYGAGIGGGGSNWAPGGSGGIITINGGVVAASSSDGAGIGGGASDHSGGNGGNITINGGVVTASSSYGAGIGGGHGEDGGAGGNITITGGTITAISSSRGAGIGAGHGTPGGAGGTIIISGGTVTASSVEGAGIGGGLRANGGNVTISGGTVTASSVEGAGIGDALNGSGGTFSTNGGSPVIYTSSISDTRGKDNWSGSVYFPLTVTGGTASGDVDTHDNKTYGKYGGTITLTANISEGQVFTGWQSDVTIDGNSFAMPGKAVTVTANYGTAVASVTVGDTVTNYGYIQEAFAVANHAAGSTLKLLTDVTADAELWVHGSFTLDLNGKQLDMGNNGVSIFGSLTVKGAQENSEIYSYGMFALRVSGNGTLNLKSGTIESGSDVSEHCAVRVEAGGTATIEGGEICGGNCISNAGTLEMKGGTLEAYRPGFIGLCISNHQDGSVTITGDTLVKSNGANIFNTATGITLQGGSFPDGISFTDDFLDHHVRSLLGEGYAFYNLSDNTLMSVGNNDIGIRDGVVVLPHDHSFTCEKKDDFEHARNCTCGYSETEPHRFDNDGFDNDGFCEQCDAYQPADYEAGSYGIKNAGQLFWFADYVNNSEEPEARPAWGQLQNDITIPKKNDGTNRAWTPIGTDDRAYRGMFSGNGHSISGLYFAGEMPYASLFGVVEGPESIIADLTVERVEYDFSVSTSNIAGICGVLNDGQIRNCTNAAVISCHPSNDNAAGICYQNNGTISGCTNTGTIDGSVAGGICVTNIGSIEKCTNTGTIHGTVAGGICVTNNGSIEKCTNEGAIQGGNAGGICADNGSPQIRNCSIKDCANRVRINASYFAGGICARNFGTVSYSYHYGILNGGPIVDEMHSDGGSCSNCYYLADWETDEIDGTTFKTQEQFASGEVAYLLCDNPGTSEAFWGQTLAGKNKQNYPVLNGEQVYRHNSSCPVYSNSPGESGKQHSLGENGICERCGAALVATVSIAEDTYGYLTLQDAFKAANEHTATITLLRDANIGEDETLEISGGEVTFQSAEKFDEAEEPTFYTITLNRHGSAIDVMGGTFNFESGILKFSPSWQQYGIVVNSGGTLNFRGGAITGSTEVDSIKMVSGEVNISGGTVGLVETSSGTLNISGGTVHALWVDHTKTELSGGSFQKIQRVTEGDVVFTLLADGYAYYCDGKWVYATNGDDAMTLEGDIWVRSIPVKINTQPKDITLTYGEDKSLFVEAKGDRISYLWFDGEDPIPEADGSTLSLSTLNAVTHNIYCHLICDDYVLDSDTVTVTVNKAIVTTPTIPSNPYTGNPQTAEVPASDRYTVTKNDGGTDVGDYDVVLTLKDSGNYQWDDKGGKTTFQITKADNAWMQVPAISGWTYGNTASTPTYKAKFGTVKVEYKASDAEDSRYSETVPTTAGSYTARFTVADSDNFNSLSEEKNFTINPKDITVTITPNGGTYGGTITPATAEINEPLVGNDQVDVTLTYTGTANDGTVASGTTAPTKAGTYTVTASINNGNYNLTGDTTAEFVIEKATVTTPTVDSKVYNGNTQTAEVPTSERYTVTENKGGTDAGDYNVVLSLTDSSNYQWDDKGGKTTFQITKTTDNIWTQNPAIDGWAYGETANQPTGAAQFGTVKVEYKVKDAEDGSYSATVPTQAGSYTARFTVADTNNFNGLSEVRDFTIGKVSLTVKAKDHTITYGEKPANGGVEYSDFVDGEDASVLGGTLAYDYSYSQFDDVGDSYTITPKGLTSDNYDITFEQGTLTVQQKEIGISWGNTQLTYNGSAQIPTATPTGLENNDAITLAVSGEQTNVNVDTPYTATVTGITGEKAGNYALPQSVTTTFSIAKKEVTITGTTVAATKVYDGNTTAQITSDGTLSANYDGDNLTIVRGTAAYDNKNVGESKRVTFSDFSLGGSAAGNYTLTAQPAPTTASITKKPVTLAITVDENIFDGTNGVNYSTSLEDGKGFVDNDDVAIEGGDATFAYCYPAENIPVTFTAFSLTGADAGNYSITNPTPENVTGSIKVSDRYLNLENNDDFAGQTEVWVDGVACPVQTDVGTYVAQQNADTFPKGSAGYNYVHDIIGRVANLNQSNESTTTAGG